MREVLRFAPHTPSIFQMRQTITPTPFVRVNIAATAGLHGRIIVEDFDCIIPQR
jgi:hypothetical protein